MMFPKKKKNLRKSDRKSILLWPNCEIRKKPSFIGFHFYVIHLVFILIVLRLRTG